MGHEPRERMKHLNLLLSEIDIWQISMDKSIAFSSSESLAKGTPKEATTANVGKIADTISKSCEVKEAIEKLLLSHRCESPSVKNPSMSNSSTLTRRFRHSFEQEVSPTLRSRVQLRNFIVHQVVVAIGGESAGYVFNSMECFTLGYDGWKCSIPAAVAMSGMGEPTQVMPPMKVHRAFAAVCSSDYNIFVMGNT